MEIFHRPMSFLTTARLPAFWTSILIASGVGALFLFASAQSIEGDARERFDGNARSAQYNLSARIKSYTNVLRGASSLFQASENVTRAQFHDYVAGLELDRHFPAIKTINFAAYVRDEDRPAFDRRMQKELDLDAPAAPAEFKVRPPGRRPEYSVLKYIEPGTTWAATFGLDLLAVPQAGQVMIDSRDAGTLITSGLPIAAISGPNQTGLGMRLPIYRPGMPSSTIAQRRAAYIGSVGIAFSVQTLVQGILAEVPIKTMRMTLYDISPVGNNRNRSGGARRLLFDSIGSASQPAPPLAGDDSFSITLPIDFNGRIWNATFSTNKRDLYTGFTAYLAYMAMAAGFFSSLMLYALFHTLISSRGRAVELAKGMTSELRDSQARLQVSHENLRRLAAHADRIKEGERKRIAREIHDDLGQNLLALRIEADMLTARTSKRHPHLHARASSTLFQIDKTIKSVRQIINDLRPNVLDLGLSAAVEWQISEFVRRSGIACELVADHADIGLNDNSATAFFRILQESLSNIVRHAHATQVRVQLRSEAGHLLMTVGDNGVGFHAGGRHKSGSFGLIGIEERINILGGHFSITSVEGEGTTVLVSVPIKAESPLAPPTPTPVDPTPPSPARADTHSALS